MSNVRVSAAIGCATLALCLCAWVEAGLARFGVEANAITFSVGALVIATGALAGRHNQPVEPCEKTRKSELTDASLRLYGILAWSLAVALAVAVEMWELLHSPRSRYPTLSSLANDVIGPGHRPGRAIAFFCWAAVGLILTSRPRPKV